RPNAVRLLVGLGLITPAALLTRNGTSHQTPVQELAAVVVPAPTPIATVAMLDEAPQAGDDVQVPSEKYAKLYKVSEPLAADIHEAAVATGISPKMAFG